MSTPRWRDVTDRRLPGVAYTLSLPGMIDVGLVYVLPGTPVRPAGWYADWALEGRYPEGLPRMAGLGRRDVAKAKRYAVRQVQQRLRAMASALGGSL